MANAPSPDLALRRQVEGRLMGLRVNRYSWWTHWRELADYLLPRRYKWLITPNQQSRGSPINQHILDSTGTIAARNLASGMMSGISSPTRPWLKLKVNRIDSTGTNPVSLWLAECERLMMLVFQASNYYVAMAVAYFDLVVFGTAVVLIYEDFENVIRCENPCLGEYYLDVDGNLRPAVFYREFVYTVAQTVDKFGAGNCSETIQRLYKEGGSSLTRELIIAHAIEPNTDGRYGIPKMFAFREVYWEWGGSQAQQTGSGSHGFLRKCGFHENPAVALRWDLLGNDPYGRAPGMDALPDVKQLQMETRRKAQAVDKHVNPPMLADVQLKNQPASLLPGGTTYIQGMMQTGNAGMAPAYGNWRPDTKAISEDLQEVRERIKKTFFNDVFQTISQFETRSNVTAFEIDARRAEALIMMGPVLERVYHEGLQPTVDRVFAMMSRAGIFPPAPQEIQGANIDVEFVSVLATAQAAAATAGIERLLQVAGNIAALEPAVMDKIDTDYALDKYSTLMNNDPKLMRANDAVAQIRAQRQQMQQAQQAQEQMTAGADAAKVLSETSLGGGQNALQMMTGI